MALKEEIESEIKKILREQWTERHGTVIPESEDLKLGNDAVKLDGTVLYADLSGSTKMVEQYGASFCAEVYKIYLYAAAKLVRDEGGTITAYDGDRIMAVFIGDFKNTSAVRCGMKINYAVNQILNPALKIQYPKIDFAIRQMVGIDTSSLFIARTGVRGANDLVWVGRAANYAAKLTELDEGYPTWITSDVYVKLGDKMKYAGENRTPMWEARVWKAMSDKSIYRSSWWWTF
jgi:class 3 adenylate cyclase